MIFASGCKKLLTVKTKRAIAVSCLVLQVSSHLSVMGLLKTSLLRENTSKTRKRLNGIISYFICVVHFPAKKKKKKKRQLAAYPVFHFEVKLALNVVPRWPENVENVLCFHPHSSFVQVQCCPTSTETTGTVRDGEPRTATQTFTQLLNSQLLHLVDLSIFIPPPPPPSPRHKSIFLLLLLLRA